MLAYPRVRQDGQIEFYWFDADGPAATAENMRRVQSLRREQAINDGVQIKATDRRWNATHPGPEQLHTDMNLDDEVTWRLNGMDADDEEEKAG
jgi:hypothetical protein